MATERFIDIKVRTGSAESDIQSLDNKMEDLSKSTDKASRSNAKLTKTAKGVKTGIAGVGRGAGQAGIQVQQFIGQIQGGQNAMLAFSQQSADLGFVLGAPLLGAIAGISASIAGILLPELFKADEAVDELTEKMKEWKKTIGLTEEQAEFLINKEIEANTVRAESIASRTKEINEIETALRNQKLALETFDLEDKARKKLLAAQRASQAELAEANALRQAETQLIVESGKQIDVYASAVGVGTDELEKQTEATVKLREESEKLEEKQATSAMGFSRRLSAESDLIREEISIREEIATGSITRQEAAEQIRFDRALAREAIRFESQIISLGENQLAIEEATIAFNEKIEVLEDQHQQRLTDSTDTGVEKRINLEETYSDQVLAMRLGVANQAVNLIRVLVGDSKAGAIALIALQKGLAIGEILINSQVAAVRALAELGPIAGPPAAASMLAYGKISAGLVAATGIAQAAGGGGGGSVPSASSAASPSSAPVNAAQQTLNQTRVVDIRIPDDALLTGTMFRNALQTILTGDDDIVLDITNAQQDLVRTGVIDG